MNQAGAILLETRGEEEEEEEKKGGMPAKETLVTEDHGGALSAQYMYVADLCRLAKIMRYLGALVQRHQRCMTCGKKHYATVCPHLQKYLGTFTEINDDEYAMFCSVIFLAGRRRHAHSFEAADGKSLLATRQGETRNLRSPDIFG